MKFTTIANAKKQTKLSYLGGVNISQKIIKSQKVDAVLTYAMYLAPASTSGYQVCPFSTPECRKGCLATSGRAAIELWSGINTIHDCRIKKTKLFFEQQDFFMAWLIAEIKMYQRKAVNKNLGFAVRLNGTSDVHWQQIYFDGLNIFEHFPEVQFYDYTKQASKFENKASNYNLTLSYTGRNWDACKELLNKGINVAMVFNIPQNKQLPTMFDGFDVIDGDITDTRFKDKKGGIAGLHWKNIADRKANDEVKNGCFCVQPDDVRSTY